MLKSDCKGSFVNICSNVETFYFWLPQIQSQRHNLQFIPQPSFSTLMEKFVAFEEISKRMIV